MRDRAAKLKYDREYAKRPEVVARRKTYDHWYYHGNQQKRRGQYRAWKLKSQYGLTVQQYDAMVAAQDGKCALCCGAKPLKIDHCHSSGRVRGLLCNTCNTMLGQAQDDVQVLERAISYLEKHRV